MNALLSIVLAVCALAFSGQVCAQFSQPPPSKAAPVCSEKKKTSPECKELPVSAYIAMNCGYFERGEQWYGMECTAIAWDSSTWRLLDPSTLKYYWAWIVDGQEYYPAPMDATPTMTVPCGMSRQGYVRATVSGDTVVAAFQCSGYEPPSGQ
jgi:hypothetical protein